MREEEILRQEEKRWGPPLALILLLIVITAIYLLPAIKTTFAGSHTMYKYKNDTGDYTDFCKKCHESEVRNITSSGIYKAHNTTQCICHGYNPNVTGGMRNINLSHNLTKDIYCTNCHTKYNETDPRKGEVLIANVSGTETWTENQSAHYMTNITLVDEIYNRSWRYFNRSFGPL